LKLLVFCLKLDLNYKTIIFNTINIQSQLGWLLVTGHWLLAAGLWLLVTGCWSLASGRWSLAAGYWLLVKPVEGRRQKKTYDLIKNPLLCKYSPPPYTLYLYILP
jgi:hypothetical protein